MPTRSEIESIERVMSGELRRAFLDELARTDWQQPAEALADSAWDVLIAGAGPAGSTAAAYLATGGHRVLLIDEERFPRAKACGDALTNDALRCLGRLGLAARVREMGHRLGELLLIGRSGIEVRLRGAFLTLDRAVFDALLARHAVASGAVFARGAVEAVSVRDDGSVVCAVSGCGRELRARVGVLATGARLRLARELGLVARDRPSGMAVGCRLRSSRQLGHHVICCDASVVASAGRSRVPGVAWIFPIGDETYNIGCGVQYGRAAEDHGSLRECFGRFTTRFALARELAADGELVSPVRSGVVRSGLVGARPVGAGNVLVVGETLGATLPFSGAGIGKAMETAEVAAAVIHEALDTGDMTALRRFPARLRRRLGRCYRRYRLAEALLSRGWINDFLVRCARRSAYLRRVLLDLLMAGRA
jgi:geranylgeranyl reductase family protein